MRDMSKSFKILTADVSAALAGLRADTPETLRGFSALAGAAMKEGALDKKTKELIAMAMRWPRAATPASASTPKPA
jgi:alkylhydroperoxidase/carboxymuconolactone decarboxylase family protein YurZ